MTVAESTTPGLHAVGDDERAPAPEHATIVSALAGSSRDVLAAMRKALAQKLDDGVIASNAIASSYKELRELDRQIRALDSAAEQEAQRNGESAGPRKPFVASAL